MRRILAVFLALIMCLGALNVFAAGKEFIDVKSSDWFYNDVKTAVELGLINGKNETTYDPNANLTYAEAIKLAACMNQLYTIGSVNTQSGNPWYMPYVEYCKVNKIINKEYNYNEQVTRAGYMEIFANALSGEALAAINTVTDDSIPDVPSSAVYASGVYKLYRAGILQGVDAEHNCSPNSNIRRCEVATILTRMMDKSKRVKFTLVVEPLKITADPIGGALDVGGTIITNVEVTGGVAPYTYQWMYNDGSGWKAVSSSLGKVSGETTARISIKASEAISYKVRCVVKDANGTEAISGETDFTFKGQGKLRIEKEPEDVGTVVGKPVSVTVKVAGGAEPYKYQWACDTGTTLYSLTNAVGCAGGDTDTLYYVPSAANEMRVCCIITDAKGATVTSKMVNIIAHAAKEESKDNEPEAEPFVLVKGPKSATIGLMDTAGCEVEVKGGVAPYTYQWYREYKGTWTKLQDENGLKGATTAKMTFPGEVAGAVKVMCVIKDAKNSKITSPAVTITVEDKNRLEIATQPVSTTVKVGEDAKLSFETKGGSGEVTYQWQWDMSEKGGWINMTENDVWIGTSTPDLTVKSNAAANLLIRCVITDTAKNVRIETESVRVIFE